MLVNLRGGLLEETIFEETELAERLLPVAGLGLHIRHIVNAETTERLANQRFVLSPRPLRKLHYVMSMLIVTPIARGLDISANL